MITEAFSSLLLQFGTSAVALALLAWLAREITTHWLSKDIEVYKETLRSELSREEFVFRQIRERRALVVASLFSLLQRALNAAKDYVMMSDHYSTEEERREAIESTAAVVREARHYFDENRIWLEGQVSEKIETLLKTHGEGLFAKFTNAAQTQRAALGKDWVGAEITRLIEQSIKEVPEALRALEDLFRVTLGSDMGSSRRTG